jgi:hypothetical protein
MLKIHAGIKHAGIKQSLQVSQDHAAAPLARPGLEGHENAV